MTRTIPFYILPIIVLAQFLCTSTWFATNAVMIDLASNFNISTNATGHLTSFVQFGFIFGTLVFAIFNIADKFSPAMVFMLCAIAGATFNLGILWPNGTYTTMLVSRFLVGLSLAGIYPVGMKIASDYYQKGLGKSLGYLVGALVLGTALPHLLRYVVGTQNTPWQMIIIFTSMLTLSGGLALRIFVGDGPNRIAAMTFNHQAIWDVFKNKKFRSSAFGYFGHMWELYAFWAFVPFILKYSNNVNSANNINVSLSSFFIIGIGSIACIAGGYIASKYGTKRTASSALWLSLLCCLISPIVISCGHHTLLILFMLVWGMVVIADSPLFSTLVAQNAIAESKGTALTIVNCIGFSITIASIQFLTFLSSSISPQYLFLTLAIGPAMGLVALRR